MIFWPISATAYLTVVLQGPGLTGSRSTEYVLGIPTQEGRLQDPGVLGPLLPTSKLVSVPPGITNRQSLRHAFSDSSGTDPLPNGKTVSRSAVPRGRERGEEYGMPGRRG